MTAFGTQLTCWYSLSGFFRGTLNNSTIGLAMLEPVTLNFYLLNQSLLWPFSSVGINVSPITISDSRGDSYVGTINTVRATYGFGTETLGWPNGPQLLRSPGVHQIFLNMTITPYSEFAIYKLAGLTQHLSIEWNVTIEN